MQDYNFAYPPQMIMDARPTWGWAREPVLQRMPDGALVCFHYSGGPTEPHNENVVLLTRSADDGATWSKPVVAFDHPVRSTWVTEIFTMGDRPCAFVHTLDASSHYNELHTYCSFTSDQGKIWTAPVSMPGGVHHVSVRQGFSLHDGTWVFPCYWQEMEGEWDWQPQPDGGLPKNSFRPESRWFMRSGVLRSVNRGQSFTLHGYVRAAGINLWEPNAVEIAPNRLVMWLRAEGRGVKYRADSSDGGLTWTAPEPTDIPDPSTKITVLSIGDAVVMLHNRDTDFDRRRLALWVSRDGGRTWPQQLDLVGSLKAGRAICYPHAFADSARALLYVACDLKDRHLLIKIPFADFL